jgi:DMSO/TMAO reductase YedYZ molybdopterin-dependent catalytic subunit
VSNPVELNYSELVRLPKQTVPAMMECAGNNRSDLDPKVPGNPFEAGAISNAIWAGAPLKPFLQQAGYSSDAIEVLFEGADSGEPAPGHSTVPYQRSLPLQIALHPDTMLVYEMSGETLTPEHGFPVRLVVPRWYGMASVKWLTSIRVIERPFAGFFQTERYVMTDESGVEGQLSHMAVNS